MIGFLRLYLSLSLSLSSSPSSQHTFATYNADFKRRIFTGLSSVTFLYEHIIIRKKKNKTAVFFNVIYAFSEIYLLCLFLCYIDLLSFSSSHSFRFTSSIYHPLFLLSIYPISSFSNSVTPQQYCSTFLLFIFLSIYLSTFSNN